MCLSIGIDHMGSKGFDVADGAMFRAYHVAVTHQRHTVAVYADDAVYDIAATFHPCQYYIAPFPFRAGWAFAG